MSEEIDFNHLTYHFKSPNLAPINFIGFRGPLKIYKQTKKWYYINKKNRRRSKEI